MYEYCAQFYYIWISWYEEQQTENVQNKQKKSVVMKHILNFQLENWIVTMSVICYVIELSDTVSPVLRWNLESVDERVLKNNF